MCGFCQKTFFVNESFLISCNGKIRVLVGFIQVCLPNYTYASRYVSFLCWLLQYENDDFWCHARSPLVHPIGWSQLTGHKLHASAGEFRVVFLFLFWALIIFFIEDSSTSVHLWIALAPREKAK